MKKALIILALLAVAVVAGFFAGEKSTEKKYSAWEIDTVATYVDTIRYFEPIPKDSVIVRFLTISVPNREDSVQNSVENVQIQAESVPAPYIAEVGEDTSKVVIPITQKVYKDSCYTAWVSGYLPKLDSIEVDQKIVVVSKPVHPKRWNVGLQGGYGITPKGFQPYIGIGVTFNLIK